MVGHYPEDDQEGKEAKDVSEENDALGKRQMVSTPDVESDDQESEGKHQKSYLPCCRESCVGVADCDKLLYDARKLNGA